MDPRPLPYGRFEVEDDELHVLSQLAVIVGAWRGPRRSHRRWRLSGRSLPRHPRPRRERSDWRVSGIHAGTVEN
nr:MAG TPA: hypothetical protein [Caudoviricetes sp.]